MSIENQDSPAPGVAKRPQVRWLILGAAIAFAIAAWTALGVGYFVQPSTVVWIALITAAAISLEVLFWVGAGVLGWSIFAKRRAALERWRQRLFGKRGESRQSEVR
ncbi:MAG: hypothetical protein K2P58_01045 [Hyphomonadaceae bacterium]|nr:hypothetical protein [Hyphomonadaceae bacterium]